MLIGCPREIKNHEYRVGRRPRAPRSWSRTGTRCGSRAARATASARHDEQYRAAGAKIVDGAGPIFAECEMVVKVKEPQPEERAQLRDGQILYTYLHLAPDPEQTADLVKSGVTAIAYETVTGPGGTLPLLKPMSQVAGRMSIQAGATALEKAHGGRGVLLGGVPGVLPGTVAGDRRRRGRVQRRADGGRAGRRRDHPRPRSRSARDARRPLRKPRQDALLQPGQPRRDGLRGRPGDRRGAGARRRGAQAGHARHARRHEARRGAGRRGDRPGRLLRDQPSDHPRQPDLSWSTASSTTASPTCPARWRGRAPMRSTT